MNSHVFPSTADLPEPRTQSAVSIPLLMLVFIFSVFVLPFIVPEVDIAINTTVEQDAFLVAGLLFICGAASRGCFDEIPINA